MSFYTAATSFTWTPAYSKTDNFYLTLLIKISMSHLARSRSISYGESSILQKLAATFVNLDEIVDISRDRDCFLYMYKRAYNIYWPNEHYRTRHEPPKTIFFKAIVTLGAQMCSADGDVGREELAAFRNYFQLTSESFPQAGAVFNEALQSTGSPETTARKIKAEATDNRELLEYVLVGLAKMAVADGLYEAR